MLAQYPCTTSQWAQVPSTLDSDEHRKPYLGPNRDVLNIPNSDGTKEEKKKRRKVCLIEVHTKIIEWIFN
jgi:hypothetical protein